MLVVPRPTSSEYDRFYNGYVQAVPDGNVLDFLEQQKTALINLLTGLTPEQESFSYEPGKWTLKEVVGHMVDTEWVFSYRLLRFGRGDQTLLPGMDQDDFMAGVDFGAIPMPALSAQFNGLRTASHLLISSFTPEDLLKKGTASGVEFSVQALIWILAGHCQHHMNIINQRYLSK